MGSLGDIHPFMGLALELQQQGAKVLLVSGESYREYIESFGIPFASARPNLHPNRQEILEAVLDKRNGPRRLHKDFVFKYIRQTHEDVLALSDGFDLIVGGSLCFFVPTIAEQKNIPWVNVTLSPVLLWSAYDIPTIPQAPIVSRFLKAAGPKFAKIFFDIILRGINFWASELHHLRKDLGLKKSAGLYRGMMSSPHLNLMLFSKYFAAPQPDWPIPFMQTGFVDFDGQDPTQDPAKESVLDPEIESFLNCGEAPVLFTLGSTASELPGSLLTKFIEASKLITHRSLFVVGADTHTKLKHQNNDKTFFASYVPYKQIMKRALVIVHQGGIGTTAQALKSSRPSLIVAEVNDQPDNGVHLNEMGAGRWIHSSKANAETLAQHIEQLVQSEEIQNSAKKIAALLNSEKAAMNSAQKILSL